MIQDTEKFTVCRMTLIESGGKGTVNFQPDDSGGLLVFDADDRLVIVEKTVFLFGGKNCMKIFSLGARSDCFFRKCGAVREFSEMLHLSAATVNASVRETADLVAV